LQFLFSGLRKLLLEDTKKLVSPENPKSGTAAKKTKKIANECDRRMNELSSIPVCASERNS
jgi:hypothetical protein